jgi:GNAT superfamily N-acetyltransferase
MPASPKPVIRAATHGDAAAIAGLLGELDYPCTPSEAAARLARLGGRNDPVFVATDGGRVVGLVALHLSHMLHLDSTWSRITAIVVAPAHRRRGVGEALLTHAEQCCLAAGAAGVELTCREHRADAHRFYARHGYAERRKRFFKALE